MTHMTKLRVLFITLAALLSCAAVPNSDLDDLKQKADAVLAVDRPEGRPDVDVVFAAADALAAAGRLADADHYYAGGLGIQSHDFERHLAYAQLLEKENKIADEKVHAQIILKGCEDAALVEKARSLLGAPPVEITAFDADKVPAQSATIVLVPLGEIDTFLLQQEQSRLHEELGIDVQLHTLPLKMQKSARNSLDPQAEMLRVQLKHLQDKRADDYANLLKEAGMSEDDLNDDAKVFGLVSRLLQGRGQADQARQIEQLAHYNGEQWAAEDMLADLAAAVPGNANEHIRFIGVTREDIFSEKTNFLFGWAQGRCAIISYHRFTASFNNEVASRERLLRRFHFQCLSSAGRVFGIPPCSDPTCPRCYPHSLPEQDAKSDKLCDTCRQAFDAAFKAN